MSISGQITYFCAFSNFGKTKSFKMEPHTTSAAPFAACSTLPIPRPRYTATSKATVAYGIGLKAEPEYAPEKARLRAVSHPQTKSSYEMRDANSLDDAATRSSYCFLQTRFCSATASSIGRYCSSLSEDSDQ